MCERCVLSRFWGRSLSIDGLPFSACWLCLWHVLLLRRCPSTPSSRGLRCDSEHTHTIGNRYESGTSAGGVVGPKWRALTLCTALLPQLRSIRHLLLLQAHGALPVSHKSGKSTMQPRVGGCLSVQLTGRWFEAVAGACRFVYRPALLACLLGCCCGCLWEQDLHVHNGEYHKHMMPCCCLPKWDVGRCVSSWHDSMPGAGDHL